MAPTGERRRFTLEEARELLPTVKRLTAEAVRDTEAIVARLRSLPSAHRDHEGLEDEFRGVVDRWIDRLQALEVEVKGLWLVDFDNGDGYYCWCYPEESVTHFHGYEDGFAGRMKIV